MFRDEKLELKVGLFIGVGIFLMFLMVFSIGDFYLFREGYGIRVIFDYVNGITKDAPVRLAGVHVGEVQSTEIYYDGEVGKTRVKVDVWIEGNTRIEEDAVVRINTLGLLGEQYLEISPGEADASIKDGDVIIGKNPVNVGEQMEKMSEFVDSASGVMKHIKEGEGTFGKLLMDDTLYEDLEVIFGRLRRGEGTLGKLLVEEKLYDDLENFADDIKAHPWKLLHKTRTKKEKTSSGEEKRGTEITPY